jgi:hypothetical protein
MDWIKNNYGTLKTIGKNIIDFGSNVYKIIRENAPDSLSANARNVGTSLNVISASVKTYDNVKGVQDTVNFTKGFSNNEKYRGLDKDTMSLGRTIENFAPSSKQGCIGCEILGEKKPITTGAYAYEGRRLRLLKELVESDLSEDAFNEYERHEMSYKEWKELPDY